MDFKFEEILKNIFPGLLVMTGIHFFITGTIPFCNWRNPFPQSWKDFSAILLTIILVVAYVVGYINDLLSSWFEDYILFKIIKKPTYRLLAGKTNRIILTNRIYIFNKLQSRCKTDVVNNDINKMSDRDAEYLFQEAKTIAEEKAIELSKEKLDIFYKSFNFARNFLTALIIVAILFFIKEWQVNGVKKAVITILYFLPFIFILYRRWLERGLYHSRIILNIAKSAP